MQSKTRTVGGVNKRLWAGRIISALPALLLLSTSSMKLMKSPVAVELMARLGYPEHLIFGVGILELACALVYIIPRTSVLGAILLTAYLGGAIASRVRIGDPLYVPVLAGLLVWAGIVLREDRLFALIPLRNH